MDQLIILNLPKRPAIGQLIWVLDEVVHASAQLDAAALRRMDAALAEAHKRVAAALQPHSHTQAEYTARPARQPMAASPRQAARLIGINHPLFFREVMPLVHDGVILSCQIGRQRVILLESLQAWLEHSAAQRGLRD
mgnify:CR=1 FL=1